MDKDKYEIYTMSRDDGYINIDEISTFATILKYNSKIKFLKSWNYIKALYLCDILYLPRKDGLSLIIFLNKFFKKKIFITVEGLFDDYILKKLGQKLTKKVKTINNIEYVYSITHFMKKYNEEAVGIRSLDNVLYLGIDTSIFTAKSVVHKKLKNIIFIGNDMQRKGIYEYLSLAKIYTDLTFHIVGSTHTIDVEQINNNYKNVTIHGMKNPQELNNILQKIDLHILPSKSEGFPKVIFETASIGIPSIVYDAYGAHELLNHQKNGFVVNDFDELSATVNNLNLNNNLLYQSSLNAILLAKEFSWQKIVKKWELEIDNMALKH